MRIIAGEYYDIQEGLEKASGLEEKLFDEFGDELDRILKDKERIEHERQLQDWEWNQEYNNSIVFKPLQAKINRQQKTRNALLTLVVLGTIAFTLAIPALLAVSAVEAPSSIPGLITWNFAQFILLSVICNTPLFLVGAPIAILLLSFSISSKKGQLPKPAPKPILPPLQFQPGTDAPSQMVNLSGELVSYLKKAQKPFRGNNNHGLQGEDRLVQRLGMLLNDEYVCVRGAMVEKKLDADVILVGPSGIWILESKYISGKIIKDYHGWRREKLYHEIGGRLAQKNNLLENVESQWKREKEAILWALRNQGLYPFQAPVTVIKGGVVFTHHNSELELQESVCTEVGNLDYWCEKISGEQETSVLTNLQVLAVVNALLQNARRFNTDSRSAVVIAEEFYIFKRKDLLQFIDRNQSIEVNETVYSGVN